MLAMAVAGSPDLVIADEPTTALDVTVQAQVLALLRDLRDEIGCSFVLITHDFGVASQIADRVAVMYGGRLAEMGRMDEVLAAPTHPYTEGLLRSRLDLDLPLGRHIATLRGEPPDPRAHPPGCAFAPRCERALDACVEALPEPEPSTNHGGVVACINPMPRDRTDAAVSSQEFVPIEKPEHVKFALLCNSVGKDFWVKRGVFHRDRLAALRNVILQIETGESVAIVGESGSGKSTLLRVVAGLLEPDHGEVVRLDERPQMVFQDAGASLTPWLTVGEIVSERLRGVMPRGERGARVEQALRQVGLPPDVAKVKAGSLSGGQRQRVAFARATIVPPKLLLCDEPTSALDASLAGAVLNLLQVLRRDLGMAVMFVTHDLAAARFVADRIAVMYLGEIVEVGTAEDVVNAPQHPYTKALLKAVPTPGQAPARLAGEPASPLAVPTGCSFHPRCAERVARCSTDAPALMSIDGTSRLCACLLTNAASPVSMSGLMTLTPS